VVVIDDQALAYATGKLHGATAALSPAGAGMGQVAGYSVADYLLQHASQERRNARVPASTWDAILSHTADLGDAARLADSASSRLLYRYAIPLYRPVADAGDTSAAARLTELLAEHGDLDEAVQLRLQVLRALVKRTGFFAELFSRLGGAFGTSRLAELLAEHGDMAGLRALAKAGEQHAGPLAGFLAEGGDLTRLRARADAGDQDAASRMADLLADHNDLDEWNLLMVMPRAELQTLAEAGDEDAARVADLLAKHGDPLIAIEVLRAETAGKEAAAWWLADGCDLAGLQVLADTGNENAAWRLADLLAKRGDLGGLRALTDAGNENAALQLPGLMAQQGRSEEAARLRQFGLNPDGSIACE
jgi:hypothetical protein